MQNGVAGRSGRRCGASSATDALNKVPPRTIPHHFGSILGAKWEPSGVKMAIKIASKFEVDLEEHFKAKKSATATPKVSKIESKLRQNRSQGASEAKVVNVEKNLVFPKENQ